MRERREALGRIAHKFLIAISCGCQRTVLMLRIVPLPSAHQRLSPRRVALCLATVVTCSAVLGAGTAASAVTLVSRTTVRTTGQRYDATLRGVVTDLDRFWRTQLSDQFGKRYRPVRLATGLTPQSDPINCDTERVSYRAVRNNAFYTSQCDLIAWDDDQLFPQLSDDYGDVVIALVLAHEWGHAIQARVGVRASTIILEQQADCFAGAWAKEAVGGKGKFLMTPDALDTAIAGLLSFRDPVGTSPVQEGAHGSAFDRVNAFQQGYASGVPRCAQYVKNPPAIVQRPFQDRTDAALGGNLPLTELLAAVTPNLNTFWGSRAGGTPAVAVKIVPRGSDPGTCDGAAVSLPSSKRWAECPSDSTLLLDANFAESLSTQIGDFGVATVMSRSWAIIAMRRAGKAVTTEQELQADCWAGAWTGEVDRDPNDKATLSPGDLDEAVSALLFVDVPGNPAGFDRVSRFRNGYFSGPSAC